ncbi:hypothetical protein RJ640_006312 [Escallonia rubra]|uniref:Uncharacterized protein n=1 Tax=Escallonia rubra TaxID=112253 RepID=A0AA88UB95_9ASTE|nr:hypothetical protein RJ640_006312 [Escallonia rubra]
MVFPSARDAVEFMVSAPLDIIKSESKETKKRTTTDDQTVLTSDQVTHLNNAFFNDQHSTCLLQEESANKSQQSIAISASTLHKTVHKEIPCVSFFTTKVLYL